MNEGNGHNRCSGVAELSPPATLDNNGEDPLRVYIAGAHSTGKTTLARWTSREFGLPMVNEVARSVLAEMELPLTVLRTDLTRTEEFQREVFRRQEAAELKAGNRFVSDRTFDNLAYMAHHTLGLRKLMPVTERYCDRLRQPGSVVFFVRPHRELLADDGVRAGVNWEEILRIDGMVKLLLEIQDIDYVTIDTLNMAERARTMRCVLSALRVRQVAPV